MDDRYRLELVAEWNGCYHGIDEGSIVPEDLNNDGVGGFGWFSEKVVEGEGNRGMLPHW